MSDKTFVAREFDLDDGEWTGREEVYLAPSLQAARAQLLYTRQLKDRRWDFGRSPQVVLHETGSRTWHIAHEDQRAPASPFHERTNPRRRGPIVASISDTDVEVWEERDRLHIRLYRMADDRTITEWWDDDAREAIEDGFLDPRDLAGSAHEYAKERGLVRDPSPGSEDLPRGMRHWEATSEQRFQARHRRRR